MTLFAAGGVQAGTILFVVNNVPDAGKLDIQIIDHLDDTHTVNVIDQTAAVPDSATYDLVIISNDVGSGTVGTKYTNVNRPLINYEFALFDELKMSNSGSGNTSSADVFITSPAHPMAAGLGPGAVTVYNAADDMTRGGGNLAPGVTVVATHGSTAGGEPVIWVIDEGDQLQDLSAAPGKRIGLFLHDGADNGRLNADGLKLLDAAVDYALGGPVIPEPSTFLLAALGLLGLMGWGRRRRRT